MVWKNYGIYLEHTGTLSLNDIREHDNLMYSDVRYNTAKFQIINFLNVANTTLNESDIITIAAYELGATFTKKQMKIAYAVTNKHLINLINSFRSKLESSSWDFEIFDNLQDAEIWCLEQ